MYSYKHLVRNECGLFSPFYSQYSIAVYRACCLALLHMWHMMITLTHRTLVCSVAYSLSLSQ